MYRTVSFHQHDLEQWCQKHFSEALCPWYRDSADAIDVYLNWAALKKWAVVSVAIQRGLYTVVLRGMSSLDDPNIKR